MRCQLQTWNGNFHRNPKRERGSLMIRPLIAIICLLAAGTLPAAGEVIQSARTGLWSAKETWQGGKVPGEGAKVLIRAGDQVVYDVESTTVIRGINIAGTLTFATDKNTRLDV